MEKNMPSDGRIEGGVQCQLGNIMRCLPLFLTVTTIAFGQAAPSIAVITNAAIPSMDLHVPARLQARSMATIFGTDLSSSTASTAPPWVKTLSDTEVHLVPLYTACGTPTAPANLNCDLVADLIYVSPTQINFVVPDVSPSTYGQQELGLDIVFMKNGQRFDSHTSFYVSPVGDFAVFGVGYDCDFALHHPDACGYSPTPGENMVAIGAVTDPAGNLITSQNPVHQGQIIALWATGLGGLSLQGGLMQQKQPAPIAFGVSQPKDGGGFSAFNTNWKTVTPVWAGESPQYPGLGQMNLIFPSCTGTPSTSEQRYDVILSFHAPSADSNLGIGFATLYMPFLVSPGEATCEFKATTSTTLASGTNPSLPGSSLVFTATVSPSDATGTVTFSDGSTVLASPTLTRGDATFTTTQLSVGTHAIVASYSGDATYGGSAAIRQQMVKFATTTSVSSSANPSTSGQPVTLTAAVTSSSVNANFEYPSGTVTFFDGATAIGTATLSPGVKPVTASLASITTSGLTVGNHSVTAAYNGDANTTGSTSSGLTQVVNPAKFTISTTYSPSNPLLGQIVTFTVTASNPTATGTVTLFDGTATIGTSKVSGGQSTFSTSTLSGGNHTITANYSGDSNFASTFTSITLTITVIKTSTTITVTSSANPTLYQPPTNGCTPASQSCETYPTYLTLKATISPAGPSLLTLGDSVRFYAVTNNGGTASPYAIQCNRGYGASMSSNVATCPVTGGLLSGTSSITAVYSGNINYLGSTSDPLTQVVNMRLWQFGSTVAGQTISFTCSTGWSTGGIVTFYDGSAVIGSGVASVPKNTGINF
jgi:uncharacterized protein (TIGR03437 family)